MSNEAKVPVQISLSGRSGNTNPRFHEPVPVLLLASVLQATSTRKQASPGLRSSASGEAEDSSPEGKKPASALTAWLCRSSVWLPIERQERHRTGGSAASTRFCPPAPSVMATAVVKAEQAEAQPGYKSNSRGASPQPLAHGPHAIDATPARRRGGARSTVRRCQPFRVLDGAPDAM